MARTLLDCFCGHEGILRSAAAGKSMPHFLFYRNGTRVAVVAGANMPEIEALLKEHAPTSPDADVLEENPMWIQRQEEKAEQYALAYRREEAALMGENE